MKVEIDNGMLRMFDEVEVGECFIFGHALFMKIDGPETLPCGVNLETGKLRVFIGEEPCYLVDGVISIRGVRYE